MLVSGATCTSPTEPAEPFRVDLTTSSPFAGEITQTADGPQIRCAIGFRAEARGKGSALWTSATFRWYAGVDRQHPLHTEHVDAAIVSTSWTDDRVSAASTDSTVWEFVAGVPFELMATFRYRVQGRVADDSSSVRATCGVQASAAHPPPTIRILSVLASDDTLETSDTLYVTFQADGASGIWESGAAILGATEAEAYFAEQSATSVTRRVGLVIPSDLRSGGLVALGAYAMDGGMRVVQAVAADGLRVWDVTRPTVEVIVTPGEYATHATFGVAVQARDNSALAWLHWQLGNPALHRDSATVTGGSAGIGFAIAVEAGWATQRAGLRVWATDVAGNVSETFATSDTAFRFLEADPPPSARQGGEDFGRPGELRGSPYGG